MDVYENEDGSFVIDWDPLNKFESQFNNWTEKDFIKAITDALQAFEEFEQEDLSSPEEQLLLFYNKSYLFYQQIPCDL